MRYLLIISNILLLTQSCSFNKEKISSISAVDVSFKIVTTNESVNRLQGIGNHTRIINMGNLKMYVFQRVQNKEEDLTNVSQSKNDTINVYYVLNSKEKRGICYDFSASARKNRVTFDIDSVLASNGLDYNNLSINRLKLDKPFQKIEIDKNRKIEKYVVKKVKQSDPDTIIRYFDKTLKNAGFSLSDSLDKAHNSKLVKTKFIHNQAMVNKTQETIFVKEVSWVIEKVTLKNPEEILKLFDSFREDSKKANLN